MRRYIIQRVLLIFPTLFLISFMVFCISRVLPGDVVELMVSESGYADDEKEMREMLGLDKPLPVQYFNYMKKIITKGDLGVSLWSGEPVRDEIAKRLPISLNLTLLSILWTIIFGVTFGVLSAIEQDSWMDYVLRSVAIGGLSIPNFWLATMLLVFGSIWFSWIPPMNYVPFMKDPIANISQLLIPSFILALARAAAIMRMTRTMMLEVMREDYIRTARSKGLSTWLVIVRHALKNAMIPVVSITGIQLAFLIGGTVVMESIFVLPGMGRYMLEAINWRDYPAIQGVNLVIATGIVLINLIVDLTYGFLNPKIRYQ
ncbi:MAG: ABC transporter permease [Deltaproteobacteria bacterium]|nr:ABC transporter permease [Deltaproteobacteria bacterium]MBW1847633.1 ABC transporter permease [Deltaproteobacteria bacterium]MBW2363788.1 ABC transporter permease [Deltaproteobacteria bacterium]